MSNSPKVIDDDKFTITVSFNGKMTRSWHYDNDEERRRYMVQAREYCEGWYDGIQYSPMLNQTFHAEFERVRDDLSRLLDLLGGKDA